MRKLIALLLVVLILASLCTVAFADDGSPEPSTTNKSPTTNPTSAPEKPSDSPKTGVNPMLIVLFVLLGVFGVFVSTRKLLKNN